MQKQNTVIQTIQLSRSFQISAKKKGLLGAIRALFHPDYQIKHAVQDLDLNILEGEIVGYIGVNGAGKSTTIKMLTGILAPTSGSVSVLGRDPFKERIANTREIGVVFGQRTQLWWDIALEESLRLLGEIHDIPKQKFEETLATFTEVLELGELLRKPVRSMSLGQKMRAELAAALIHSPKIVYLDEPTIGLDIVVKQRIRDFIKHQNEKFGITFILTTHDLSDIEQLCKRVVIIDAGAKIYDGSLEGLKDRLGKIRELRFDIELTENVDLALPAGCELDQHEPGKLVVRFDRTRVSANQVVKVVVDAVNVKDFSIEEPSLEAIISQIYKGEVAATQEVVV